MARGQWQWQGRLEWLVGVEEPLGRRCRRLELEPVVIVEAVAPDGCQCQHIAVPACRGAPTASPAASAAAGSCPCGSHCCKRELRASAHAAHGATSCGVAARASSSTACGATPRAPAPEARADPRAAAPSESARPGLEEARHGGLTGEGGQAPATAAGGSSVVPRRSLARRRASTQVSPALMGRAGVERGPGAGGGLGAA